MLRDGLTGDWIGTFIGHKGAVWQGRLSGDTVFAATGSADFTAKIWDTFTGVCLHTMRHEHIVRAVAFPQGPKPHLLATGGFEKKLRLFDIERGSEPSSMSSSPTRPDGSIGNTSLAYYELGPGVHGGTIKSIVWGADFNLMITAADDKMIRWWDIRTRSPVASVVVEGDLGTCELNTSSKSSTPYRSVLSVAAGKTAYFFDGLAPGQLIKKVKTPHDIASLAFNIEARKFVVGGASDTWVREYGFDDEKEMQLHKGHHGPVWSTNFSPNGKIYATGSEDGTIKLWKCCEEPYGLWK
ncbi:hypothetical protein MMC17_007029 [Xylographa soralifera]|nr:hypothetical protein [Xylographa soralifera]